MIKNRLNTVSSFQLFQMVRYGTLILTGIVLAKSTLSQSAIGEYETFLFLAGAVSFFWLNGLLKALLPLSAGEKESNAALFSSFVLISVFSLLVGILIYLLHPFFSGFLLNGKQIPELNLLVFYLVIGVPANLVEYVYLVKKRNKLLLIYAIISFTVQFLLVVLPVVFGRPVSWAMRGLVASSVLRYIWLWGTFVYYSEIRFSLPFVKKHLKLGMPLVAATLLSGSAQFIDGFIVTSHFDESTFAVFRYGARELPLATLLANALSSAMLPEFGHKEKLKENLEKLKQSVSQLMHFIFPLTAVLLLVSKPLFPIIFNPDFAESATVFNIYLLLVISRLLMPQTILNGLRQARHIMVASFFELVINVALSLVFVQYWGIAGIAFATFIAYLFEKIYLTFVVRRNLNIRLSEYHPVKYYLYYSLGLVAIFIFAEGVFP
ncbi:oligosaccharide flippase family protein [Mariniphaga sp.]|uniref:oligosaccharide flippase family protein n=1 Tax=Mariniphaga sp. TaxID=1954475 RepID=UPI003563D90F